MLLGNKRLHAWDGPIRFGTRSAGKTVRHIWKDFHLNIEEIGQPTLAAVLPLLTRKAAARLPHS